MRTLLALAGAAGLLAIGISADDDGKNVGPRYQPVNVPRGNHGNSGLMPIIMQPGVVDQGVKPLWRQPPPHPLPMRLTCTAGGAAYPFAWDGMSYAGLVGQRRMYLNVYRGHAGAFGWAVSPPGAGQRPPAAYYGREVSRVPLAVEVPVEGVLLRFAS